MRKTGIRIAAGLLVLLLFAGLAACKGKQGGADSLAGKTFVWEKEGFGGDFTITLKKDGTFEYYEGYLSSFIGTGTWKVRNSILVLLESEDTGYGRIFRFSVGEDELRFLGGGSDDFGYVQVKDGDRFLLSEGNAD